MAASIARPQPPSIDPSRPFVPDATAWEWICNTFLRDGSPLHNEEHAHLIQADVGVLWTSIAHARNMNRVAAAAEVPMFQGAGWKRSRQEQQMWEWFGSTPDFVITIDACIAAELSDAQFCALIEHELYHCAQALDQYGAPKFTREGRPKFAIRGHDVEEFVGVVRRYGAGNAAGRTAMLIAAAQEKPLINGADISRCCGTCQSGD